MGYYRVLQSRNPLLERCKKCNNSGTLRKSRCRNTREKILKHFFRFGLYRCKNCGWRGFIFKYKFTIDSIKALAIYLAFAIFTGFVVKFVITRFLMK